MNRSRPTRGVGPSRTDRLLVWAGRLTLAALIGLGLLAAYFHLLPIALYGVMSHWQHPSGTGPELGLADYTVSIEARPIHGLTANTSGLTFSEPTGTLLAVINRPPAVAELTLEGELLRLMPLHGVSDPEGIAHIRGDLFIIADERDNRLHWARVRPGDRTVETTHIAGLRAGFDHLSNLGFEGVSWDATRAQLLVANEKWPRQVLAVKGLTGPMDVPAGALDIEEWHPTGWLNPIGSDLSSLTVHEPTGNLLLLSEESAVVTEYSREGKVLGLMPLWRGMRGLRHKVPQPEGITMGPDEVIYLVSEPNLFYRFSKAVAHKPHE